MKINKNINITVLYNLPGQGETGSWAKVADEDTQVSAMEIKEVLELSGFKTQLLGVGINDLWKINKIKSDLVFNLIEWAGKDIKYAVEAFRELVKSGIPYTGSDIKGYLLSVDKVKMKKLFVRLGIPTPKWQVYSPENKNYKRLDYPVILKPAYEHCGIGISQDSIIDSNVQLSKKIVELQRQFDQPILAEEYIDGKEVNVTVLEKNLKPWVLPPIEVVMGHKKNERPIFSYNRKWNDESAEFWQTSVRVAKLGKNVIGKIIGYAKKAYLGMGGRDYPRLDFRMKGNIPMALEINNNPEIDFTFQGGIRESAAAVGLDYGKLLTHVVEQAHLRFLTNKYASI
jgi:D-alanine-D-alanine ligase